MAIFTEVGRNLFTITFNIDADKLRVIKGRLRLFDNDLFVPKPLAGHAQANLISFNTKAIWL